MIMRGILFVLALAVAACASGPRTPGGDERAYMGEDAGYLVYSVGTVRGFGMRFAFPYEPVDAAAGAWGGAIKPTVGGAIYLKILDPDFEGFETGHVVVRALPPGQYEIRNLEFYGSGIGGSYQWSAAEPFLIPFTVEPGQATYIGSYMRSLSPEGYRERLGAAGYFLVADRSGRDLPIARARLPEGVSVETQFTDVEQFGNLALRSQPLEPMIP